ncbi:class I SAM-dependent methyltransferase [Natronococcus occultus]|uniref:Methylase involved in ubiquinone/menaquinone biosynthesis n=1 Tax=Natronococcus occultus SP4 TaxID=694430 RepID=L0K3Z7_9EURY|nr:class I SAM-dependent methyltransferase [Natronococcus occultus]AGB38808.1 methylase involved in ubiquinone/menaquinone biosynthesis [Natronococcus occultus SP4]
MADDPENLIDVPVAKRAKGIFNWYQGSRMEDFDTLIGNHHTGGGRAASVACGDGQFEAQYLDNRFEEIIGVEFDNERVQTAKSRGVDTICQAVPPLPFEDWSLDAVVSLSSVEHFPDERQYVEEVVRCLRPGGTFYLNMPIEVGIGGLLRFFGKNVVHPTCSKYPDSWRRFIDYSIEEFRKQTPRDKHGTGHRYYNYTYLVDDLRELFDEVEIYGWPNRWAGPCNVAYFARATRPQKRLING